jgi:hypothetical protein
MRYPILSDRFHIQDRWREHLLPPAESVVLSVLLRGHCLNFLHPSPGASVTPTVAAEGNLI